MAVVDRDIITLYFLMRICLLIILCQAECPQIINVVSPKSGNHCLCVHSFIVIVRSLDLSEFLKGTK